MNKPRRFIRLFKPQFAVLVESGRKTQTVRPVPKRMPRPGDIIECRYWSGKPYRSKQFWCADGRITRVVEVRIEAGRVPECPDICCAGSWLDVPEMEAFAAADGFASAAELGRWFHDQHGLPFEGVLIEWELVRPENMEGEAHGC